MNYGFVENVSIPDKWPTGNNSQIMYKRGHSMQNPLYASNKGNVQYKVVCITLIEQYSRLIVYRPNYIGIDICPYILCLSQC